MTPPRIHTEVQVMFFDTDCGGVVSNINSGGTFLGKKKINDRRVPKLNRRRNFARAARAAPAADAARAFRDSNRVGGAVARSNNRNRRSLQSNRRSICRSCSGDVPEP